MNSVQFDNRRRGRASDSQRQVQRRRRIRHGLFAVSKRMVLSGDSEPGKRIGHVSVLFRGKLIVWGGYNDEHTHRYLPPDQIWIYEPLSESWTSKKCTERLIPVKDMPPGTSGASAALIEHHMYIFGGYTDEGNTNHIYRVNLSPLNFEDKKNKLNPQVTFEKLRPENPALGPTACDKNVSWTYDGRVYVFGGYGLEPTFGVRSHMPSDFYFLRDTASHWHYQRGWNNQLVCYDPEINEWLYPAYKGKGPCPRAAHAMAQIGSKVYIFGGRSGADRLDDLWVLDMDILRWTQLQSPIGLEQPHPEGRSWHSLTAISPDEIVLYGGLSNTCEPLKDCWTYSQSLNRWSAVVLPSEARLWHTAVFSPEDAEVLIYGGGTQNILNYRLSNVYTNDLITLRFSPKSLLRLSLDASVAYAKALQSGYTELPGHLQRLVKDRQTAQVTQVEMAGS